MPSLSSAKAGRIVDDDEGRKKTTMTSPLEEEEEERADRNSEGDEEMAAGVVDAFEDGREIRHKHNDLRWGYGRS